MRLARIVHLVHILFLSVVTIAVPLRFADPRDFYHELGREGMLFIFEKVLLNNQTVEVQNRLLSNDRYDIQFHYNHTCSLINYERASTLVTLIHGHKELEMRLLGAACLSKATISARKTLPNLWPPTGFPLLVQDFRPCGIDTNHIKEILAEALKTPQWWQSSKWIEGVNWEEMNDWRFWRMIPPSDYANQDGLPLYILKIFFQIPNQPTPQDLEELLMKSIRMPFTGDLFDQALEENGLNRQRFLLKFSELKDPWSIKVLSVLRRMYSTNLTRWNLPKILLNSNLLKLASWQGLPRYIDMATATNDILELFTEAIDPVINALEKKAIIQDLEFFLDDIADWSILRPVVMHEIIVTMHNREFDDIILGKHADKMLKNTNILDVIPAWFHKHFTALQAHRQYLKISSTPLKDLFGDMEKYSLSLGPYNDQLYQIWVKDKINWPGARVVHERSKRKIRIVFKPSKRESNTWDPDTGKTYGKAAWELAFSSVLFDVTHGIPSSTVPSFCFLQALLYYRKSLNENRTWAELEKEMGDSCDIPKTIRERARYMTALRSANAYPFENSMLLRIMDVGALQALIRGDLVGAYG